VLPYLEQVENIADSDSEPLPPPLPRTEIYPSTGASPIGHIVKPWEHDPKGCLERNLQINSYNRFATCEEYKYMQCGIKKKGMKTCYDNILREENPALCFPCFKNGVGTQKLTLACRMIKLLRSGNDTLSRIGDKMIITNALSKLESRHQQDKEMVNAVACLHRASHLRPSALLYH